MTKCEECDQKCEDHKTQRLLLDQHGERIAMLESTVVENSNDNNNLEGRINMFTWFIGMSFLVMISLAYMGLNRINVYKDVASLESKNQIKALAELTSAVTISSERAVDVKNSQESLVKQVDDLHIGQELIKQELSYVTGELEEMRTVHVLSYPSGDSL